MNKKSLWNFSDIIKTAVLITAVIGIFLSIMFSSVYLASVAWHKAKDAVEVINK